MVKDKKYGVPARIGKKFDSELEEIKLGRMNAKTSKEKISTEKITNLIAKHKDWPEIKVHLIKATEGEVENAQ